MSTVELKGLRGLRNLGHLISESTAPPVALEQIEKLSLDYVVSGKYQPRKHIDESALNELADSIKAQGIIQPLIVREIDDNNYEIIAGERRWRAAKIAGLTHVPAIIRDINDNVALAFALIENIQRENLNPIEEAVSFARFKTEFAMTHDDIARMIGRSRASVTNTMRLLSLSEPVRTFLEEGRIDMGHARALLMLDADHQIEAAQKIVDNQLSVRETEKLVNTIKTSPLHKQAETTASYSNKCEYWQHELSNKFSAKVSVKLNHKGAGKIVIQVDSPDEIDWIIEHVKVDR